MANTGHMDDDQPNSRARADLFGAAGSTLRLRDAGDAPQGDDTSDAEARMRAALGLFGSKPGQAAERASHHEPHGGDRRPSGGGGGGGSTGGPGARRHRFVQDGEVPVSVVRGRLGQQRPTGPETDRQAEELAHERQLRAEVERKLADKEIQLRSLQTRIGHAELERDNAVAELREERDRAAAAAPRRKAVSPADAADEASGRGFDASRGGASERDAAGRDATGRDATGRAAPASEAAAFEATARDAVGIDQSGARASGPDTPAAEASRSDAPGTEAPGVEASELEANGIVASESAIGAEEAHSDMPGALAAQRGRRGPRRRLEEPQLDFVDPEPVKWWL